MLHDSSVHSHFHTGSRASQCLLIPSHPWSCVFVFECSLPPDLALLLLNFTFLLFLFLTMTDRDSMNYPFSPVPLSSTTQPPCLGVRVQTTSVTQWILFVASGGADVCSEEGCLGGMVWRRKASANESIQDRTALVIPKKHQVNECYKISNADPPVLLIQKFTNK